MLMSSPAPMEQMPFRSRLMALELEPGDEVIVPSFTFVASVEVIALLRFKTYCRRCGSEDLPDEDRRY